MIGYKLTDQNNETYNGTKWGAGVTHETSGEGEMCGPGWLHFYDDPVLAVILNPIHANIPNPKMWEIEAEGQFREDNGLKFGCTRMTTIREIKIPDVTLTQRVAFAILCAMEVSQDESFKKWGLKWLSGEDRSAAGAWAAARAEAWAAARAAARAAGGGIDLKAIARKAIAMSIRMELQTK